MHCSLTRTPAPVTHDGASIPLGHPRDQSLGSEVVPDSHQIHTSKPPETPAPGLLDKPRDGHLEWPAGEERAGRRNATQVCRWTLGAVRPVGGSGEGIRDSEGTVVAFVAFVAVFDEPDSFINSGGNSYAVLASKVHEEKIRAWTDPGKCSASFQ